MDVDFLPITWQPALETVGEGATAEVRQSLINVQTSFVFKRPVWRRESLSDIDESREFQRVASEIRALAHPEIRGHRNVIRLEGLCWDILPDDQGIWPVMVFERASYGNLIQWSDLIEGRKAGHDARVKLGGDIANGVSHLHRHSKFSTSRPWTDTLITVEK